MANFKDFFGEPTKNPVEPPEETRIDGAFMCQYCDETVPYAHRGNNNTLYWICTLEHHSKIPWPF